MKPLVFTIKAEVDPNVDKAFTLLSRLANTSSKDAASTAKAYAEIAKEVEELAKAAAEAAGAMGTAGKETARAIDDQADAAKRLGNEMQSAGERSSESLKKTRDEALTTTVALREISDSLEAIGGPAADQLQGLSDTLFGLASRAAQTAQQFETMEAQLKTVLGTQAQASASFDFAKDFAVKTPFDVKEITEATVTLESYKQRSQEVLPLVVSLAAGMNKELGATSLVVGKAMSGSLEGFESLRNEYGISTRELVKYGAETNKMGGIMVQTAGQIDKARNALAQIIKLRFGEALADRAETVSAAVSNAGDAMINFAADVGEGVAPLIKLGAVLTEKVFSALQAMPTAMKAGLGATVTLGSGVAGLGAITLTTALALFRLDLELKKIVASNAAAAAATGVTSTQMGILTATSTAASAGAATSTKLLTTMGNAANFAGKAFTFLTRTPVGLALTGVAVAGTAAKLAIDHYANAQIEAGRKTAETSQIVTKLTFDARQLTEALRELGGEEIRVALAHKTLGERSAALADAIKNIPAGELAAKLKGLNLGPEELKGVLAAVKDQSEALKTELQDLMKERERLLQETDGLGQGFIEGSGLQSQFDELDAKIKETTDSLKLLGNVASIFAPVQELVADATAKFDELAKSSQRALDFNRYAGQAGGQNALRTALSDIQAQIDANDKALSGKGYSGSKDGVLSSLRSGNYDDSSKALLEAQLDLYSALEAGEEKLASMQAQAGEKRLSDIEKNLQREKAVREVSRDEELAAIDKAIAAARALGEKGADDETRLLEERKSRKAEWLKEDLDATKSALDQQLAVSKAFVERLNTEGAPQGEVVAAYDRMITKLKEWQAAHGPLLATNKELAQEVSKTMAGFVDGKAAAQTKLLDDNLKALKDSMAAVGSETEAKAVKLGRSVTNAERLADVDRQIDLAKKAQASSAYKTGEADKVLADLAKERLSLEQTITQAKLRQAGDVQKLAIEGLQKEIELLELRREAGFNVDAQLAAKSAELREARIKDLELTYQAEREAADDKLAVEAKYQLARANLEKDFTIEAQRQADKRVDVAKDEKKKLAQADARTSTAPSGQTPSTSRTTEPADDGDSPSGPTVTPAKISPFVLGKGFQLRDRNEAARQAKREGFAQGNSAAVGMVAQQDADRAAAAQKLIDERLQRNAAAADARQQDAAARQQAAEAARNSYQGFDAITRGITGRRATEEEYARLMELRKPGGMPQVGGFSLPSVPDELRAASPKHIMQDTGSLKSGGSPSQTVNNNQTLTVNVNVSGKGGKTVTASSPEDAVAKVRKAIADSGFFNGDAGGVV